MSQDTSELRKSLVVAQAHMERLELQAAARFSPYRLEIKTVVVRASAACSRRYSSGARKKCARAIAV